MDSNFVVSFGDSDRSNHAEPFVNLTLVLVRSGNRKFYRYRHSRCRGWDRVIVTLFNTDQWMTGDGGNRNLGSNFDGQG